MIAAVGAFLGWLGVSTIVLADGRRGLAAGLAVATAGLAAIAWQNGDGVAAVIVLIGGGAAAVLRYRAGPGGWAMMPPGSTPRLIMCVAGGLVALWFAASVTTGSGGATRFAVLSVIGLSGARIVSSREPSSVVTAVAVLALSAAIATHLGAGSPGLWPYVAAALVAAAAPLVPVRVANAS
ncbi:MAG TPA: hypothetical protein VLU92_00920 [Candidatus Dormibacteraeota bacterium]|nr:hypothetical protein [Candidatus Dormibacteraeota bacterium]